MKKPGNPAGPTRPGTRRNDQGTVPATPASTGGSAPLQPSGLQHVERPVRPARPAQVAASARAASNRTTAAFAKLGREDAPPSAMSSAPISSARAAAFTILTRLATTAAHSDDLLHAPAVSALSTEDRNLTTALVLGVLRWQMALDLQIRPLLQRPDAELHPTALLALRLALFQVQYMDRIPPHAAINESVELARANGAAHAAGMVNALLRRFLRERDAAAPVRQTLAAATPAETAHPAWLLARWRARYGGRATRLLTAYDQAEPPSHGLFDRGENAENLPLMDDGSRLIAELAAAAVTAPTRILDACAAPGGKTRVLALRHPGVEIVAADVSEKRLASMRLRLDREPAAAAIATVLADMTKRHRKVSSAEEQTDDAETGEAGSPSEMPSDAEIGSDPASLASEKSKPSPLEGLFDLILVDAPCSGTGTLARNPEIRHRLREGDLPRQAERQRAILQTALRKLTPDGRLVYSTCSMEPEENEAVVAWLLAEGLTTVEPLGPLLARVPMLSMEVATHLQETAVTAEGALRTVPGVHAADGFYAVVLRRP